MVHPLEDIHQRDGTLISMATATMATITITPDPIIGITIGITTIVDAAGGN
jgi:hypothetical protein